MAVSSQTELNRDPNNPYDFDHYCYKIGSKEEQPPEPPEYEPGNCSFHLKQFETCEKDDKNLQAVINLKDGPSLNLSCHAAHVAKSFVLTSRFF